jgi:hypothetical protein
MSALSWWRGWVASCKPGFITEDSRLVRGVWEDGLRKKFSRQKGVYAVSFDDRVL